MIFMNKIITLVACLSAVSQAPSGLGQKRSYDSERLVSPGIIIGGDAESREKAQQELLDAADTYFLWTHQAAPFGAIILNQRISENEKQHVINGRDLSWSLNYDLTVAKGLSAALSRAKANSPTPSNAGLPVRNVVIVDDVKDFYSVGGRSGVLAHEICHKYASVLWKRSWNGKRALPDMLDEMAAISCETQPAKTERLIQFSKYADSSYIPFDNSLNTAHPLKTGSRIAAKLQGLALSGQKTLSFQLPSGSDSSKGVAVFYGQAGAFIDYLQASSCSSNKVLGRLLTSYDPESSFDNWLRLNGASLCLPTSVTELDRLFRLYVARNRAGQK